MEKTNTQKTFMELLRFYKNHILVIILITLVSTIIGLLVSKFALTPKYTAVSSIYVLNRASEGTLNQNDIQTSTELLNDYKALIKGKSVMTKVIDDLQLDMSPTALANKIDVTSDKGTRVLLIKVTDENKELATLVANKVWKVADVQLKDIMDVEAVNLVYEATVPTAPSSPDITKNTVISLLVGFVLIIVILTLVFMLDNRIKSDEGVEYHLGIKTLGVIPYYEEIDKNKNNKHRLLKKKEK